MDFVIHALKLHKPITLPESGIAPDGTAELYEYRSLVAKNDLEPNREKHLADGKPIGRIEMGTYLFTQGNLPKTGREEAFREAAEALWLEALWLETEFASDRVFVRILSEDSKTVFQAFRETTPKA